MTQSWIGALCLLFCLNAQASDHLIRFRQDNPDLVVQVGAKPAQRDFLLGLFRDQLISTRGIDLFARPIDLPMIPLSQGLTLDSYLDARLARIIRDSLRIRLNQVTTTLDAYKLSYRIAQPVLELKSSQANADSIDLTLGFKINKLEIDVDNILISNHSPGVSTSRQADDQGRIHVSGRENMTLIDDIYLRLKPADGHPILSIETSPQDPSVLSGTVSIRVAKTADGTLGLSHLSNRFDFFEGGSSSAYAEKIQISIGTASKVGGLDAIEIGRSEIRLGLDVAALAAKKRAFISDVVGQHLASAIRGIDLSAQLVDELSKIRITGTETRPLSGLIRSSQLALRTELNTIGVIDADQPDQQQFHASTNSALLWLDNSFTPSGSLPFPISSAANHARSLESISNEIRSGNADLVVSLGQDYLNHLIHVATRGHIDLPNDPSTRKDDGVSNGRKGVFMILEGTEAQGKIVVDVMVKPRFLQAVGLAIATLKTKLYFPVVILPELKIESGNGVPMLSIRVRDFDLTEETLRNGIHGVESNLNRGINRKFLIKKLRQTLSPMIGTEVRRIPLTGLEGLNPASVTRLESDHLGRLNIKVRFDSQEIPKILQRLLSRR